MTYFSGPELGQHIGKMQTNMCIQSDESHFCLAEQCINPLKFKKLKNEDARDRDNDSIMMHLQVDVRPSILIIL